MRGSQILDAVDRGGGRCVNANFDGRTVSFDAGASLLSFLVVSSGQLDLGDQRWSGSKDQRYLTWRRSSLRGAGAAPSKFTAGDPLQRLSSLRPRCGRKCKAVALIVRRRNDRATSGASPAIGETVGYWRSNLETVVYGRGKFEPDSGRQRPDRRPMSGPHRVSQSVSSFALPTPDRRMALWRITTDWASGTTPFPLVGGNAAWATRCLPIIKHNIVPGNEAWNSASTTVVARRGT